MDLEDVEFEDITHDRLALREGPHTCPSPGCEWSGSVFWVREHFECDHVLYAQKFAMLSFLNNRAYEEHTDIDKGGLIDIETEDKRIKDGIENHPIFSFEMFENLFGSINDMMYEAHRMAHNEGHNTYSGWSTLTEKIRERNSIKDASSTIYGSNWGEVRWEIYQRDNEQCRVTGKDGFFGSDLDVHHIKPARQFIDDDGNANYNTMNDPSNLILLSKSCHGLLEGMFTDCDPDEFVEKAREHLSIEQ